MFNAQHDCATARCTDSGRIPRRQERLELDDTEPVVEHKPLNVYLINTHSLHNAHLLRRAVPHDLITPVPYINPSERQAEHMKFATAWRENPKSHTAQEQVREKKRAEAAMKNKKGKGRGKKRSADEAFEEGDTNAKAKMKERDANVKAETEGDVNVKTEMKEEMTLISELDTLPLFLAGLDDSTMDTGALLFS